MYEFATERALWQWESDQTTGTSILKTQSLNYSEKTAEIARLEELLRTAQNLPEATAVYRQCLGAFVDLDNKSGIAISQGQLGRLYQEQGQLRSTLKHYLPAWLSFCEMHSPYSQLVRKWIQEVWEQVCEEQFQEWLAEDYGPQASEIRKKLDEKLDEALRCPSRYCEARATGHQLNRRAF